ncbi:hypothetical protein GGQ74_001276 [Desulfobaculum xiamenense]|uniref:Uncharacterized protein n=1 Tax=Desulfobaculum xiamenense TaxID=995050 RepID=A0A846QFR7_9BACT|nr:hypothetical protein [Desulfobaculum xiamenense]NJB67636.1 hypothetical protein [Desulfobaculum xiamenense]
MKTRTISNGIRHLEDLHEQGLIDGRDFVRRLHDMLDTFEMQIPTAHGAQRQLPPELADLVAHAAPSRQSDEGPHYDETPHLHGTSPQEEHGAKRPAHPVDQIPTGGERHPDFGRVLVKGKTPWDGHPNTPPIAAHGQPRAQAPAARDDAALLKREHLARLASATLRKTRRTRNPSTAFALSFLWAGLGHVYIGAIGTGMGLMLVTAGCVAGILLGELQTLYILAPMTLLCAATAHRGAIARNRNIEHRTRPSAQTLAARPSLDLDRAIRTTQQIHRETRG